MDPQIQHDEQGHRFFAVIDGHEAYLSYVPGDDGTLDFRHTFVPAELRGRQIARLLVDAAFGYALAGGHRVIPTCSYVRRVAERVPEYGAIAA